MLYVTLGFFFLSLELEWQLIRRATKLVDPIQESDFAIGGRKASRRDR